MLDLAVRPYSYWRHIETTLISLHAATRAPCLRLTLAVLDGSLTQYYRHCYTFLLHVPHHTLPASMPPCVGFVGSPWTLATYIIEGASSSLYKTIKSMAYSNPELLHALLSHLADAMSDYIKYQIDSGAQCVQIFDSWGGQLPPQQWDK